MKRNGFAIILVLATLVLLALLSITYIKLALIDRNIARNYMDNKRAKLIAQSGVDYAIARIQEDVFGTGWQQLNQKVIKIDGANTKYTESVGSTYGQDLDIFAVAIKDSQSMINVNDGLDNSRVRDNTKRILNVLGNVKGIANLGDRIINNRPPQSYTSMQELLKYLTQDEFDAIKNLVITRAWQDKNVANPVPLSEAVIDQYPVKYNTGLGASANKNIYRFGRGKTYQGVVIQSAWGYSFNPILFAPEKVDYTAEPLKNSYVVPHAFWGLDELNPQWIEIVSRSPVNINRAPREVLISLIRDLKGLFVLDRKRDEPLIRGAEGDPNTGYSKAVLFTRDAIMGVWPWAYEYGPNIFWYNLGSELGFLYSTQTIDQTLAEKLADEIIACRKRSTSVNTSINYNNVWYGGDFKTWRQFNTFCDKLVTKEPSATPNLLQDIRPIFFEYEPFSSLYDRGYDRLMTAGTEIKNIAHQAIADCLKANFNPNLHLNESNPDANIKALVDKTDLIVNSTEFCFTSMGHFEISSEGYILMPQATDNRVISQHKLEASVKVFDVLRQTNQSQFLKGSASNPEAGVTTSNSKTVEIGPEPSVSPLDTYARENEYDGYIMLPTLRGSDVSSGFPVTLNSHYTTSFNAEYNAEGDNTNWTDKNVADLGETMPGPYLYDQTHRLARSFRNDPGARYAPSDFRYDGAYVERQAGLAYKHRTVTVTTSKVKGETITTTTISSKVLFNEGAVSYWIKPWFYPEITGKARTFFSISKQGVGLYTSKSHMFTHFFIPMQHTQTESTGQPEYSDPKWDPLYKPLKRPRSMVFGLNTLDPLDPVNKTGGYGAVTPSLNHTGHSHSKRTDYMKSGHWMHVVLSWSLTPIDPLAQSARIFINGEKVEFDPTLESTFEYKKAHPQDVTIQNYLQATRLRIGEPCYASDTSISSLDEVGPRNWTCDSTIDEFYIFSSATNTQATLENYGLAQWGTGSNSGRYYKPIGENASFTSDAVNFEIKKHAQDTLIAPPLVGPNPASNINPATKILGVAWTWFAEEVDDAGKSLLRNYKIYKTAEGAALNDPTAKIYPKVKLLFEKNGAPITGFFTDDGYSVCDLDAVTTDQIKYKVVFDLGLTSADNTVLLYSPVFDDITIYYSSGSQYLSYQLVDLN